MTLNDDDLIRRLQSLAEGVPLPPTAPDDDVRRGRRRLRRTQLAAVSVVATVVALVIGTGVATREFLKSDEPVTPVQTPTPTPTDPRHTRGLAGPDKVVRFYETPVGFLAVDVRDRLWRRDAQGWAKLSAIENSDDVVASPGGRKVIVDGRVSHDGGLTWQTFAPVDPPAACALGSDVLLSTGRYVTEGPCRGGTSGWKAYWLPEGSATWEPRPVSDIQDPRVVGYLGDALVTLGPDAASLPDRELDKLVGGLVSLDGGLTWQPIANACPDSTGELGLWGAVDPIRQQCRNADGSKTVVVLQGYRTWEPVLTLPSEVRVVVSLDAGRWLGLTNDGRFTIEPGNQPVVGLPRQERTDSIEGTAAIGGDLYLVAGPEATGFEDGFPIYVSHDGGLTWVTAGGR